MKFKTIGKEHWEENWGGAISGRRLSFFNVFNFDLFRLFKSEIGSLAKPRVVEIGFAPGKVLQMLETRLSAVGTGYDYSESGCAAARHFLGAQGSRAEVVCRDVLQDSPDPLEADISYSIGVVEHFDDPSAMVDAHLAPLRKGGKALIVMPNYSGLAARIQGALDPTNLAIHNLALMDKVYWDAFIARSAGSSGRCFYFGHPSPWMFSLQRFGLIGKGAQLACNFLAFLVPPGFSVLPSMIVIVLEKSD